MRRVVVASALLAACTRDPASAERRGEPPSIATTELGKRVFVTRGCVACHTIPGGAPRPPRPGGVVRVEVEQLELASAGALAGKTFPPPADHIRQELIRPSVRHVSPPDGPLTEVEVDSLLLYLATR